MKSRWVTTVAVAISVGIPNAVSPATIAASVTPIPPGTGTRPARNDAEVFTKTISPSERLPPYARKHARRHRE